MIGLVYLGGQEIRDRFPGAVEGIAIYRRAPVLLGQHGELSKTRTSQDLPSSKDVVYVFNILNFCVCVGVCVVTLTSHFLPFLTDKITI